MAGVGGSVTKALFVPENGPAFNVQFNPTQFQFNKAVEWTPHDDQGQESTLEFQKSSPASITMELYFDTTTDGCADVRAAWVNTLLSMTNPSVTPDDGQAGDIAKKRPPKVTFIWGQFRMSGVLKKVDATYLMFASTGAPVRAKVAVEMMEWKPAEYQAGGGTGSLNTAPVQLVTVAPGETITAVAMRLGTSTKEICEQNNISDATADHSGKTLAIPTK
ncbi:MAG TPA: hypothetical protein DFR83_01065 [Deltaproteobacteria bacterium]|nr:hypothetical protein [Deltaproteobacteria bacterium]